MRVPAPHLTPAARGPAWRARPLGTSLRLALVAASMVAALGGCGDAPNAPAPPTSRPAVASIAVVAPPAALTVGTTYQLVATPRGPDDAPLADRPVTFASEDEAVVTVTPAGVVEARAPGTAWLTARCEGRTARLQVTVVAAPAAAPTVASLEPAAIRAGATAPVVVRVIGTGFAPGTTARWNGADRPTTVESATVLRVTLPAGDLERPTTGTLTVHAPGPDGGSAAATLPITAAPLLAAFAPASVVAGAAEGFTLALRGTGFTPDSRVTWDGAPRAVTYVSGDELRVAVTPADVAAAGERVVAVTTEGPAGARTEARFPVRPRAASVLVSAQGGDAWTWPGHALVLQARAVDAAGAPVDEREVAWRVGDAAVAALAPAGPRGAVLHGAAVGQTWAEATLDGVTARRTVAVHDAPAYDLVYAIGTGEARGIGVWSPRTGGTPGRFPLNVIAFSPAPSPDGRLVAFTGAPRGAGVDANHDVYVVGRDGTGLRRVTTDAGYDGQPAWSPDGTRLAFVSTRAGHADVYTVAADGSDVRRLTEARVGDPLPGSGNAAVSPAWSPDGTQLAYVVGRDGRSAVWVMRADGTAKRALGPDAGADDFDPAWMPDGQRVALRRVPRDGGAARLLTLDVATGTNPGVWADLDMAGLPAFSPDGRWLAVSHPAPTPLVAPWVRPLFAQGGAARQVLAPTMPDLAPYQVRWIRRP